jgi:UDP-N-acetylglucosamine:LPS N-acetylglucosamine transferase
MNFVKRINKNFLALLILCSGHVLLSATQEQKKMENIEPVHPQRIKQKMMIFSSTGGYGHQAAAQELTRLFSGEYDIKVVNLFAQGPLKTTDAVRKMSFGATSGEKLYNFFLRKDWVRGVKFMSSNVESFVWSHRRRMREALEPFLQQERPDFIISVLPVFNLPALEIAAEMGIPYLLITLDPDLRSWVIGLEEAHHPNFKVTVGYDLATTRGLLEKHKVPRSSIYKIGFPLRQNFLKKYHKKSIRKHWKIKKHDPVVLVMMGGVGTTAAYKYAKAFAEMDLRAHVIVCAGKNEALREKISKLKPVNPAMTLQPIGFTQEIPQLMTMADVVVTKPGPGSVYEAIACKTPIICNNIGMQIPWETANIDLVVKNHLGFAVNKIKELEPSVRNIIDNVWLRNQIQRNMKRFHPLRFNHEIKKIVYQMRAHKPASGEIKE